MPTLNSFSFQDSSTPIMEQLCLFHNYSMGILIVIIFMLGYNMSLTMLNKKMNLLMLESYNLEIIWTLSPGLVLLCMGIPSIKLLYLMDEIYQPSMVVKVLGNQWFWSYEFECLGVDGISDSSVDFVSYMNTSEEAFRLIESDNYLVMPVNTQIMLMLSSNDVLHSWAVPSFGVKVDVIPGRTNQINLLINQVGLYFGQCSEICGANHSFMPISIQVLV